ncbi:MULTISPECIES: peroxidase, FMP-type [unclassified Halomonas]|uniref:peroxidase, FMP-type n=1 Tax=unclassified Halomonas TaxID=2609666 RepID=UPI0007DA455A|nr:MULTISPECIES: peroxidase, FMP-type [unclassified Halomonas]MBT2785506.1 hypothetical protein [Halomonas sp. ISL-106]MBT2797810.1 hypothetical protein [Halomonas sp. ISL-104]OAL59352.1 hypothetical protein A6R74_03840 [Halomonas sp. ALS9]
MPTQQPRYTPAVLKEPANYGVLEQLAGTWVNYNPDNNKTRWGLHTTCLPSPGTNSETIPGKFHFLCQDYKEELTFTLVPGGVRNRGGANEQFSGAVKYEQSIHDLDGNLLHDENGMYLWLSTLYNHPADDDSIMTDIGYPELAAGASSDGPVYVPPYTVSRSGTIPHGSTVLLLGTDSEKNGSPEFPHGTAAWDPNHLAISPSMGLAGTTANTPINLDEPAPAWVHDPSLAERDPSGNRTYTQRILADDHYPYSVRPDLRLRDAIQDQEIKRFVLIEMRTRETGGSEGGLLNTPFVERFARVTEMNLRMWIETVVENGKEVLQLQYEQIQYFEFQFGTDGGTTRWPHIQINTLRKKA